MLTSFARLAGDDDSAEVTLTAGTVVVLDEECGPAAEKRVFELFVVKTFDLKNELYYSIGPDPALQHVQCLVSGDIRNDPYEHVTLWLVSTASTPLTC